MKILKTVSCTREEMQHCYTNIRIRQTDNLETLRQKRSIRKAVSRHLKSPALRIEALIQNNFGPEDCYCTLTFEERRLPPDKVRANRKYLYFIHKLAEQGYEVVPWLRVLEHRHGAARFHFHVVIGGVPRAVIKSTWESIYGHADVSQLRPWDVPALARYLSKEPPDYVGQWLYSRSRGASALIDPECSRERVEDSYHPVCPSGCETIEYLRLAENAFGEAESIRYLLPSGQKPKRKKASAQSSGVRGFGLEIMSESETKHTDCVEMIPEICYDTGRTKYT